MYLIFQLNAELNMCLCYYSNFLSIRNKFNVFINSVNNHKSLIISIADTWLSEEMNDSEIEISHYDMFRHDRLEGKGGGSLMYIHNCYNLLHVRN